MIKKLLFCKDCEYYKMFNVGNCCFYKCKKVIRIELMVTPIHKDRIKIFAYPEKENKNNDCIYFKEKVMTLWDLIITKK